MKSYSIVVCCILCILLNPSFVQAFVSENQQAVQLTNDTWLYTNVAQYGSTDGPITVPIAAAPNWMAGVGADYLRYQTVVSGQLVAGLDASAIVLSTAPIVDNQYVVPINESYDFIFMALVTIPEGLVTSKKIDLSLEVTSEPTAPHKVILDTSAR